MEFFRELNRRRFVQYLTVYAASGWIVLEVVDQLAGNGVIPQLTYRLALTILLAGLPAVAIVAWYHGAAGDQRAPLREKALLAVVGVLAVAATAQVARSGLAADGVETANALDRLDPTEDPRRIAVTYFEHAGGEGEAALLASGLTEALIDELSAIPALHVVSRNGVAPLRGRESFPADSVSRALQVGTFVRGTVTEVNSMVSVRVNVIDASEDRNLRSTRLERPRSELFELQEDLAEEVAIFLRETVGEEVRLRSDRAEADNVDAWVLVQKAAEVEEEAGRLSALDDPVGSGRTAQRADSLLAEAGRLAPEWPVPPTRRGWLAYQQTRWGGFQRDAFPALLDAGLVHANRALALNSRFADALELRATLNYWRYLLNLTSEPGESTRLFEQAEEDFNAAVEANPLQASALSSLSHLLMNKGSVAQAKLKAQQSYEADPWLRNANVTLWRLFQASLDLEDHRDATKWCAEGARRFADDFRFRECRVWLLALRGQNPDSVAARIPGAWEHCAAMVELSPPALRDFNEGRCHTVLAMGLVRAGLRDSAVAVARAARKGVDVDPIRELAWLESFVHAWLGDMDAAIDRLSLYLAANPGQVEGFATDRTWWLEDLRSDPRYRQLVGGP